MRSDKTARRSSWFMAMILASCLPLQNRVACAEVVATVPEVLRTPDWAGADVDSVALWRSPEAAAMLFVTAKAANEVFVCDGLTGKFLRAVGGTGTGPGNLRRPNGVAVADDFLFVVERDNRRVQVFRVPTMEPVRVFGESLLIRPYGLTVFRSKEGYELYVTDDYAPRKKNRSSPAPVGARVKHFRLRKSVAGLDVQFVRSFGKSYGEGGLGKVESIQADPARDRLFVCDERAKNVKVFDLEGRYIETVAKGLIKHDPEGLALIEDAEAPAGGWLVVTDQGPARTTLRIFSRDGRQHVGDVTGEPVLANTDGITLSPGDLGPFKRGALYCVHKDIRVQAYSWADVVKVLKQTSGSK